MNESLQIIVCADGAVLVEQESGEWRREAWHAPVRVNPHSPFKDYRELFGRPEDEAE